MVRKPVAIGIMRSGFGERNDPLLHYMEMHTGVDWAAPMGTPIFPPTAPSTRSGSRAATANMCASGMPTAIKRLRAHDGICRGLNVGSHVRQGQVIGFVGSTGLSTGAHVHYEILVNNRFVDPMRIKLPRGRILRAFRSPCSRRIATSSTR